MSIKELMMINEETILSLLKIYKDDEKILNTIQRCLISFEEYHSQIYKLEICMKIFSNGNVDKDNYKIKIEELDKSRTTYHNALLGNVNVLNRLAEKNTLPPFYDGKVSQDRPYRREVANGVLQYVEKIVKTDVNKFNNILFKRKKPSKYLIEWSYWLIKQSDLMYLYFKNKLRRN